MKLASPAVEPRNEDIEGRVPYGLGGAYPTPAGHGRTLYFVVPKRAKDMVNKAAKRRKSRRIDGQRVTKEEGALLPHVQTPNMTMVGCSATGNGGAGIRIDPGVHVRSAGGIYHDNGTADVENHGHFESIDDQIG